MNFIMITEAHKHHFWAKLSHCSNVSNVLDSSRYAKLVKTWWPHWWLGLPARNHCISEIPHLLWTWDRNSKPSTLLAELQPFTNLKNSCYHTAIWEWFPIFSTHHSDVTSRCEVFRWPHLVDGIFQKEIATFPHLQLVHVDETISVTWARYGQVSS